MQRWMWSHWQDAMMDLTKPLVFAEFGKSKRDPDYSTAERDAYIDGVYSDIYGFARAGGAFAGGLVWQLMAQGMESYYDGYEILLSQEPETNAVLARQSLQMNTLRQTMSGIRGVSGADRQEQEDVSSSSQQVPGHGFGNGGRRHGRFPPSKKAKTP